MITESSIGKTTEARMYRLALGTGLRIEGGTVQTSCDETTAEEWMVLGVFCLFGCVLALAALAVGFRRRTVIIDVDRQRVVTEARTLKGCRRTEYPLTDFCASR